MSSPLTEKSKAFALEVIKGEKPSLKGCCQATEIKAGGAAEKETDLGRHNYGSENDFLRLQY